MKPGNIYALVINEKPLLAMLIGYSRLLVYSLHLLRARHIIPRMGVGKLRKTLLKLINLSHLPQHLFAHNFRRISIKILVGSLGQQI